MVVYHFAKNLNIHYLILMDQNIAESNHGAKLAARILCHNPLLVEEKKTLPVF